MNVGDLLQWSKAWLEMMDLWYPVQAVVIITIAMTTYGLFFGKKNN